MLITGTASRRNRRLAGFVDLLPAGNCNTRRVQAALAIEAVENVMPQNYRNSGPSWNTEQGGRYRSGGERDRYRSGDEQRLIPDRDRPTQGPAFRGDRSYTSGGYQEETGYQRGGSGRNDNAQYNRGRPSRFYNERPYYQDPNYRPPREEPHAYADEYDSAETAFRGGDFERLSDDSRSYFGTGNYAGIDDGGYRQRGGYFYGDRGYYPSYENAAGDLRGAEPDFRAPGRVWSDGNVYGTSNRGSWRSESDWESANRNAIASGAGTNSYGPRYDSQTWKHYSGSPDQFSHRGRGPRGYERSDERLREIICERLTDDPFIDVSDVCVEVAGKKVMLSGTVTNRRAKYEVEELVERSANIRDIDNQLRVRDFTQAGAVEGIAATRSESRSPSTTSPTTHSATGMSAPPNKRN